MKIANWLLLAFACIGHSHAQHKWILAKNNNGIQVFVSQISDSEYYAFKAVMSVKSTDNEIIEVIRDVNNYPKWFAYTASAKLTGQSTNEQSFFMETDYPWPYSNECLSYNMKLEKEPDRSQKITITKAEKNVTCKYSLKKANGYILLEPNGGGTKITYYFHSEPSQNIPPWLINPRTHEMPYQTFISLKKQLTV